MAGRTLNKPKKEQKVVPVQQDEITEVKEEQVQEEKPRREEDNQEEEKEKIKKLYATYPILFESHQYKVGDQLPTTNMEMVNAWIEAEAAVWK
ncbi:hypothetical protein [Anaerosporobacter faecicola]|uniref:hypothetical protein n=1 Tax=Anaerosporobacter faecicola TaxID=2718714 RepID=UPI00143BDC9F|nr:hypothetical protein [Anaerosporobacter faecicola]